MSDQLVTLQGNEAFTDSMVIANGTNNQHCAYLAKGQGCSCGAVAGNYTRSDLQRRYRS